MDRGPEISPMSLIAPPAPPGVPSEVVASGLRPGPDRSPQAFNGCIHNVRINGEPQDLSYRAAGAARPRGLEGKVSTSGSNPAVQAGMLQVCLLEEREGENTFHSASLPPPGRGRPRRLPFLQRVRSGSVQGGGRDGGDVRLSPGTQRRPMRPDDSTARLSRQQVGRAGGDGGAPMTSPPT